MASETFQLAILLSLKDGASGGLTAFSANLRTAGKEGEQFAKTLDKLRVNMNRGLALGSVGLGGLALIGKGVQVAGNFQASMTDLRTTLSQVGADGKVNFDALGKDMLKAEAIAMRLGSALPGTTETFLGVIQKLKEGGLDTQTILDGAAESVANLAVANNALPGETAKDFAKFGQIYKLRANEFKGAADLFSRIYTSKGIDSGEIIQSTKYFQGRAGSALGMTGLKGADDSVRLMAYLQKQGLDSSQAGTSASTFFVQLAKNKKALEEIRKEYGVTFDLFDKKGEFRGIENAVQELEKLKKLNPEQLLVALNKLGGEEGSMAGTAIIAGGVAGWKQFNAEVDKSISLQAKNAEKAKDFNNQMEALTGSVKNLVVTGFEPLLPSLTSGVNYINQIVGSIQNFGKENAGLTSAITNLALYGSTALVVVGGINSMISAWRTWKTVSMIGASGLASYLNATGTAARQASFQVAGFTRPLREAATTTREVQSRFQKIVSSPALKLGVQIVGVMAAEQALTGLIQMWSEAAEKNRQMLDNAKTLRQEYDSLMGQYKLWNAPGDYGGAKGQFDTAADKLLEAMNRSGDLQWALNPERFQGSEYLWKTFTNPTPYGMTPNQSQFGGVQFSPESAANQWKQAGITTALHDPNMLARLLSKIENGGGDLNFNQEGIGLLKQALQQIVGNDKMGVASEILRKERLNEKPQGITQPVSFNQLFNQSSLPQIKSLNSPYNAINPPKFQSGILKEGTATFIESFKNFALPVAKTTETFGGLQKAGSDWQTSISQMAENSNTTAQNLTDFGDSLFRTESPINSIIRSANGVSGALDSVTFKLANWQPPAPQLAQNYSIMPPQSPSNPIFTVPGRAVGGVVERDGLAMVHAGNVITPARVTKGLNVGNLSNLFNETKSVQTQTIESTPMTFNYSPQSVSNLANLVSETKSVRNQSTGSTPVTINYSPQVTINGASPSAKQDFQAMLNEHSKHIDILVARAIDRGRARS